MPVKNGLEYNRISHHPGSNRSEIGAYSLVTATSSTPASYRTKERGRYPPDDGTEPDKDTGQRPSAAGRVAERHQFGMMQ
ncbi:MAG: hypothetical protein RIE59_27630 [Imperialibacter sp.]